MMKCSIRLASFRTILLAIAAITGLAVGACKSDDGDDYEPPPKVKQACEPYCAKAKECDDRTDVDKCEEHCADALSNCKVDELDKAVAKLEQCADEGCNDFIGCTVNVGAQCIFGL